MLVLYKPQSDVDVLVTYLGKKYHSFIAEVSSLREYVDASVFVCVAEENEVIDNVYITSWNDIKVYSTHNGYFFSKEGVSIWTEANFNKLYLYRFDRTNYKNQFALDDILLSLHRYRIIRYGGMILHGAVVVYNGKGIVFCGHSGAGKSTQARLWIKTLGIWALNYDKPILLPVNGEYYVCGTPWSGKEACYINRIVPLECIVFIEQAKTDSVEKLSESEAYIKLLENSLIYPLNDEIYDRYCNVVQQCATRFPVYELRCTKTNGALEVLYSTLFENDSIIDAKRKGNCKMKIRNGFMLRNIVDEWIVIPRGEKALNFSATIILNESGVVLWRALQNDITMNQLIATLMNEYDIDENTAYNDVKEFVKKLKEAGILEEQLSEEVN